MLVRFLLTLSLFHLIAINAVSAADSDASCERITIEAEPTKQAVHSSMSGCFQNNSIWDETDSFAQVGVAKHQKTVEISAIILDQFQKGISGQASLSETGQFHETFADERYGAILQSFFKSATSRHDATNEISQTHSADLPQRSFSHEAGFEALTPFAPMFEDFDDATIIAKDRASWN